MLVSAWDTAQLKRREYALSLHPIKGAGFWKKNVCNKNDIVLYKTLKPIQLH